MKIKKYEGKSELELMQQIKDELGVSAIILSIKRKPYRGLMSLFKKPLVVVQAAYEEKSAADQLSESKEAIQQKAQEILRAKPRELISPNVAFQDLKLAEPPKAANTPEPKTYSTEDLLEKVAGRLSAAESVDSQGRSCKYDNNMIQLFYDTLIQQEVSPEIAEDLMNNVDVIYEQEKIDINLIVKIVYNTIIGVLGEPEIIEGNPLKNNIEVVAFMGPTGVGKTTTIAKISSILMLSQPIRIGLITADTYRIAAVEQLKTYAEILGIDVQVVYHSKDLENSLAILKAKNDLILVDTAGRSHRNQDNIAELKEMLDSMPNCRKYLVLSMTTKYEDLLEIVNTYESMGDYNLIFTKLDETSTLGSILNICYMTGRKLSYVTFGQNVPDDIEIMHPDRIAKSLMGLGWMVQSANQQDLKLGMDGI